MLGCIASLVVVGEVVVPKERDQQMEAHLARSQQRNCTVDAFVDGDYRCATKRWCSCANASPGVASCRNMVAALQAGECNDGYRCCREECDTCYDRCCDTCRSCTGTGRDQQCSSRQCNCRDCNPYDCNCSCVDSVSRERCHSYVGTCYRPVATLSFVPGTPPFEEAFRNCTGTEAPLEVCQPFREDTFTQATHCSIDNTGCLASFRAAFLPGSVRPCWFRDDDPATISLSAPHEDFEFEMPRWTIAVIAVLSVLLGVSCLGGVCLVCIIDDLEEGLAERKRARAAASATNMNV